MPVIDSRGTTPVVQSGDLAFLQQKEQEGKLKIDEGSRTNGGTLASLTASAGKDMYLASASVSLRKTSSTGSGSHSVELRVNGVVKETFTTFDFGSIGVLSSYHFSTKGLKVSPTEVISLEVTELGSSSRVEGTITCWEEPSGSQTFGSSTITVQSQGGDLSFLRDKEKDGDLVKLLSAEFTGDGDQITFVPPAGKTFFFTKAKLYPVTNVAIGNVNTSTLQARSTDVEITNDGSVIDVLTYNEQARVAVDTSMGQLTGQFESNIFDSLIGDGLKEFKLVSTNTSGTYRVSLLGWIEDT